MSEVKNNASSPSRAHWRTTNFGKQLAGVVLSSALLLASAPVYAERADEPNGVEMAADVLVARPIGLALTTLGAAAFVVSLPFSALGGNVKSAAQTLVVNPAKATFVRCLGCRNSGRVKASAK